MASGTGLLYIGKQLLLQQQTSFNETRIYNPLSVLSASAQQGSTGLIERSISSPVQGVASENVSPYAGVGLGDKGKGYMHLQTGQSATSRFGTYWPVHDSPNNKGGFLQQLGASLIKTAQNLIPSTLPFGIGTSDTSLWVFRPEYPTAMNGSGVYEIFRRDASGFLRYKVGGITYGVDDVAPYYPNELGEPASTNMWYDSAPSNNKDIDHAWQYGKLTVLYDQLAQLSTDRFTYNGNYIGGGVGRQPVAIPRPLREQSTETRGNAYITNFGTNGQPPKKWVDKLTDPLTLVNRDFPDMSNTGPNQDGGVDDYNALDLITDSHRMDVNNSDAPDSLKLKGIASDPNSRDIIFFYFYDIINNIYIPFRATITGLNDLHTPEWDEIAYLGRADKLYVYKGFTRDVNFSFTVYANSIKEMFPMWKRINYLVGLARPSGYTSGTGTTGGDNITKQFMYPPMVTVRIGDMYVDQPCVLKSIGVNIPEDATWETQRGTSFTYLQGTYMASVFGLSHYNEGETMYQLPKKVDMTINMSIMEKKRSVGNGDHFYVSPTPPPEPRIGGTPPAPARALRQISSMGDYTKLNVYQQEALARKAPSPAPVASTPAKQVISTITPTSITNTIKEPMPIGIHRGTI